MNIVYKLVDLVASCIEIFILYEIYNELFSIYRRKENMQSRKVVMTVIGIFFVSVCNYVSVFSYFTMIAGAIYMSISALFLFKVNWIPLFSVSSFYILCISYFDFFIISIFSYVWGETEVMQKLSVPGIPRIQLILTVKILWIIFFLLFRRYINVFSQKVTSMYKMLILSIIGFFGFYFLVEQTCKMLNYSLTGVWLATMLGLSSFIDLQLKLTQV